MKSLITYMFEKQNPFNVWIMCGLPGSGKSTYIKESTNIIETTQMKESNYKSRFDKS